MTWPSGDPRQPDPAWGSPHPPPPPIPYGGYGPPPGPPPRRRRTGLIVALVATGVVVLVGLVVAGVVVVHVLRGRVTATHLAVGDCIADLPSATRVAVVPTVGCATPHAGEVFAELTLPDGSYPGDDAIAAWQRRCPAALAGYAPGAAAQDDGIGVFALYPTAQTWANGDRVVTCVATTDPKRTGSLRG